jgi:predicted nuclease of predicted toxin-antitoxin system
MPRRPREQSRLARFLADESFDFGAVKALREAGYDVRTIVEVSPGISDEAVIAMAVRENRVLLTADMDSGQLVYASGGTTRGVILARFPERARPALARVVLEFLRRTTADLARSFVVLQPGRARVTGLPGDGEVTEQ